MLIVTNCWLSSVEQYERRSTFDRRWPFYHTERPRLCTARCASPVHLHWLILSAFCCYKKRSWLVGLDVGAVGKVIAVVVSVSHRGVIKLAPVNPRRLSSSSFHAQFRVSSTSAMPCSAGGVHTPFHCDVADHIALLTLRRAANAAIQSLRGVALGRIGNYRYP